MIRVFRNIEYRSSNVFITLESYKSLVKKLAINHLEQKNKDYTKKFLVRMLSGKLNIELFERLLDTNWNRKEKVIINELSGMIKKEQFENECQERKDSGFCKEKDCKDG